MYWRTATLKGSAISAASTLRPAVWRLMLLLVLLLLCVWWFYEL